MRTCHPNFSVAKLFTGLFLGIALLAPVLLSGCSGSKHVLEINDRFSRNLIRTPYWYPSDETPLTMAQQVVLEKMGPPDFIRLWWRRDGEIITMSDLSGKTQEELMTDFEMMKKTWIYYDAEKEVHFSSSGSSYDLQDLDPKTKLICDYGDPSSRRIFGKNSHGQIKETWIWVDQGLQIEFLDGIEVDRDYRTPTGQGTWLGK